METSDEVEEFTEDTFTMQDGTHPTGLENAILGLCAGDRVNFVLFGEASLNDFEPPPKDARGEVALSGEAEVLRVSHVRKCVYTSTPEEKAAYATEMNDIGKVLFKNARLDRAREKFEAGMSYVRVCEPEDPIINPRGAKNNDVFFPIARSVYLNLALVAFRKGEYEECELYIGDLLEAASTNRNFSKSRRKVSTDAGARDYVSKKSQRRNPSTPIPPRPIFSSLHGSIPPSTCPKNCRKQPPSAAKFPNVVSPEIESGRRREWRISRAPLLAIRRRRLSADSSREFRRSLAISTQEETRQNPRRARRAVQDIARDSAGECERHFSPPMTRIASITTKNSARFKRKRRRRKAVTHRSERARTCIDYKHQASNIEFLTRTTAPPRRS